MGCQEIVHSTIISPMIQSGAGAPRRTSQAQSEITFGVVHLPLRIERSAMRREGRTEEDLLDEILEELFGGNSDAESGR